MITLDSTSSYTATEDRYNWHVSEFTVGDVIRKSRIARRWSQTKLGEEAAYFQIGAGATPINKSTVSKVEHAPYTSELGTVWRLLAALNLTFTEVEKRIGAPFVERRRTAARPAARDQRHHAVSEAAEKRGR
jgi:transcriptional regulator with XRE-family HTH domain